jgi:hypothetical protein
MRCVKYQSLRGVLFAALAGLAVLGSPAFAQIHKWVDANGVTHYGERPPANAKSKEIEVRDTAPRQSIGAAPVSKSPDLKERELEFRKRQVTRAEEETRAAQIKAQRDESCRKANAQLINMRASGGFYRVNEKGEREYMSDAERDASLARREAEFKQNCG